MDWNYPIDRFFLLSKEKRKDYIEELARFYFKKWVSQENLSIYAFTLNECIESFEKNHREAVRLEQYEKAEIFLGLIQIFHEIYEREIIDDENGL